MSEPAPRPLWLPSTGPGNLNVPPEKWAMTIRQWTAFITSCSLTEQWEELKASTHRKEAGHVNLYQVCDAYVKPWTRGTGNSVALLLNGEAPLQAELMISHAWGESIMETLVSVLARCCALGASLDTAIWFCTFAQYQPGDEPGDCGPGVGAQLALDPFKQVITSQPDQGMLVVHTSKAELYGRLWCVFEVNEAQSSGVDTNAAMSMVYLDSTVRRMDSEGDSALQVDTEKAECWSKSDAEMIKGKVREAGGFEPLNEAIYNFRKSALEATVETFRAFAEWTRTYQGNEDNEDGNSIEFLAAGVKQAGRFVGLHCLLRFAEAAGDGDTRQSITEEARQVIDFFFSDAFAIPPGAPPPPRFDPTRVSMLRCIDTTDDEEVLGITRGDDEDGFGAKGSFGGMMVGLLEMGAGGTQQMREGGGEVSVEDRMMQVKQTFKVWDSDGSGKITQAELCRVLKTLNPDFTDEELEEMFTSADANQDGMIDYTEFVDWISQ